MQINNWLLTVPDLVQDAMNLSSGTIANLTGIRDYSRIESIQLDFIEFCEENHRLYKSWSKAWATYWSIRHTFPGT